MTKVLCTVTFAIGFLFYGYSTQGTDDSPIQQLVNVIQFFNTTELCNHSCAANTWYDDYGSLNIRFKTKIKDGENAGKSTRSYVLLLLLLSFFPILK